MPSRPAAHFLRNAAFVLMTTAPLFGAAAQAAEVAKFTPAAWEAANKAGKPILVDVGAPWCPVCKAQKPILSGLYADPKYKDLLVFEVDFDSQKAALRKIGARSQSTLIAFKDGKEAGRSVGDTDKTKIRALIDKAI